MGAKRLTGAGAKRLKLGLVVTATGAKRLEDGCETSWGAKRLWCEMSWSRLSLSARRARGCSAGNNMALLNSSVNSTRVSNVSDEFNAPTWLRDCVLSVCVELKWHTNEQVQWPDGKNVRVGHDSRLQTFTLLFCITLRWKLQLCLAATTHNFKWVKWLTFESKHMESSKFKAHFSFKSCACLMGK